MDINRKEFAKSVIGFLLFFAIMYVGVYFGCEILKKSRTMKINYPETAREGVVDNYHGMRLPTLTAGSKMTCRSAQPSGLRRRTM